MSEDLMALLRTRIEEFRPRVKEARDVRLQSTADVARLEDELDAYQHVLEIELHRQQTEQSHTTD